MISICAKCTGCRLRRSHTAGIGGVSYQSRWHICSTVGTKVFPGHCHDSTGGTSSDRLGTRGSNCRRRRSTENSEVQNAFGYVHSCLLGIGKMTRAHWPCSHSSLEFTSRSRPARRVQGAGQSGTGHWQILHNSNQDVVQTPFDAAFNVIVCIGNCGWLTALCKRIVSSKSAVIQA